MAQNSTVDINLLGDLYFVRPDPETLFGYCAPELAKADLTLANLEVPLTTGGTPSTKWAGAKNMRSRPEAAAALQSLGFDGVSLANNHLMDWGPDALAETAANLDRVGIAHTGAGTDRAAAFAPITFDRHGITIGVLAFTSVFWPDGYAATSDAPGMATVGVTTEYESELYATEQPGTPAIARNTINQAELAEVTAAIAALKRDVDVVIVSWHWGVAHGYGKLVQYQVDLGHAAIDAGADIVFGHHPHVLEPVELYKHGIIAYSLGNAGWDAVKADRQAMLMRCTVDRGGLRHARVVPTWSTTRWEPQALAPTSVEGEIVISRLTQMSRRFHTAFVPIGDSALVMKPDDALLT